MLSGATLPPPPYVLSFLLGSHAEAVRALCFRGGSRYSPKTRGRIGGDGHRGVSEVPKLAYGEESASICQTRTCCPLLGCIVCEKKVNDASLWLLGSPKGWVTAYMHLCPPLPSPPHAPRPPSHVGTARKERNTN